MKIIIPFLSLALVSSTAIANTTDWKARASDWRNGPVIYQIMVDRFAPSASIDAKRALYAAPKALKPWSESPKKGHYVPEATVWSHEIDFWGGDLKSVVSKIDYIKDLGVDVVYLNPIFSAYTNHKYDTQDYFVIDPMFGTMDDLKSLTKTLHAGDMKLVLDGVFNHMSRRSDMFKDAKADKSSKWRPFFKFTDKNKMGYVGWWDVENLPELNIDNSKVQDFIFNSRSSVVAHYLIDADIDGWRLDVAYDLGPVILEKLTKKAHSFKKGSLVVGEIWNYPGGWAPYMDGMSNLHSGQIAIDLIEKKIDGSTAANMLTDMINDSGMDYLLKCWVPLDNHDMPRLASVLKEQWQLKMARLLQMTLPGAPYLFYGSELGMKGGEDPEQRGPMPWDKVGKDNELYMFHKKIIAMRKKEPALRYGDLKTMNSKELFAFMRYTDKVADTVIVVVNPLDRAVTETLQVRDGKIHNYTDMVDLFSGKKMLTKVGMIDITLEPHGMMLLKPQTGGTQGGYSRYDEVDEIGR